MGREQLISEINEIIPLLEREHIKPSVTGYFPNIIQILRMMHDDLLSESSSVDSRQNLFSGLVGIMGGDWYFEGSPLGRRIQKVGREIAALSSNEPQGYRGLLDRIGNSVGRKKQRY